MTGVEFAIVALGAFRVTRLIVLDTITDPIREATIYRLPDRGIGEYIKVLFDCPWCVGFWISCAFALGWWLNDDVTWWVALPFALSAVVGLLARNLDSDP